MIGRTWLRRVDDAHPWLLDLVLATLVSVPSLIAFWLELQPDGHPSSGADAAFAAASFMLVLARRRAPLAVLALTVLAGIVFAVVASHPPVAIEGVGMVCVYTVARTVSRRLAIIAAAGTAVTLYAVSAWAAGSLTGPESISAFAWTGMAAAVGVTVRTWRDYLDAVEERAVRAETSKEEEARRRVAEERLRIARELHDVIAHHIALINVQAGVASHLLRTEPEQADTALGHIRDAGRTVLAELGSLLYVLRQSGDDAQPTEPVPGLSRLGPLLESLTAAGLSIHHRQVGTARPLPIATDLAAYRIIQEGLTNARKHGSTGAGARLLVDYRPDALHIQIRNPVRTGPSLAAGTGHGITGMRERAHAVGGTLHAAAEADGTFHVEALLPAPAQPGPAPAQPGPAPAQPRPVPVLPE